MEKLQEKIEAYKAFVKSVASGCEKGLMDQVEQGCIGISTEAGELLDMYKKYRFQGRDFDEVNAKEECGDILFYMTELLDAIGSDIFECMDLNTKKLQARYDGKRFDKEKSINRDTDKEREILEQKITTKTNADCNTCGNTDCVYVNSGFGVKTCDSYVPHKKITEEGGK